MRIGDGRDGNSACRKRRTTLDIARWRGNDAGASGRSPSKGLRRRAGCRGTPGVDMDDGRFVKGGCRGRLHRGVMDAGAGADAEGAYRGGTDRRVVEPGGEDAGGARTGANAGVPGAGA
jgi:hypothetical protein